MVSHSRGPYWTLHYSGKRSFSFCAVQQHSATFCFLHLSLLSLIVKLKWLLFVTIESPLQMDWEAGILHSKVTDTSRSLQTLPFLQSQQALNTFLDIGLFRSITPCLVPTSSHHRACPLSCVVEAFKVHWAEKVNLMRRWFYPFYTSDSGSVVLKQHFCCLNIDFVSWSTN